MSTPLKAKKSLSQNFLVDINMQIRVTDKMKELVDNYPDYAILEIGPGQGDLTFYIKNFGRDLIALEIDKRAVEILQDKFSDQDLKLVEPDKLSISLENEQFKFILSQLDALKWLPELVNIKRDFILLSNLPFNTGSRILVDLMIYRPKTAQAIILQKEVAQKLNVNSNFTFFGAWLNLFWSYRTSINISPNSFKPRPRVYCQLVITNQKKDLPEYLNQVEKRIEAKNTLKALFKFPSKTINNNLRDLGFSLSLIEELLSEINLDKNTRLNWQNYALVLATVVEKMKSLSS